MGSGLEEIFKAIPPLPASDTDRPLYAVMPVPGHSSYFIGRDSDGRACLLVATGQGGSRVQAPIRLESLDVQFDLRCYLKRKGEADQEGTFTVIRCRAGDAETVRYFLSVCDTIVQMGGDNPTRPQVASAVNRLAAIFQKMQKPPSRPLNGLFGELYILWRSGNAVRAVNAWRLDDTARFDFSDGDVRLDVKATTGRLRVHTFSYEQCNPPPGTIAVVASLHVEQAAGGMALRSIVDEIGARIAAQPDLLLKLHEVVVATLGTTLNEALALRFDIRLAQSSLKLFRLDDVPAIRGPLPLGISDVHFRSDLSALSPVTVQSLVDRDPIFWDLLPRETP
jgi:Putative  PD-(D/E)XK family member, (DUF4420)